MPALYACTVFLSAFLLFLVQPVIAKQILPWFGGSASVWTTCLVFFQALLLAGYAYSHWSARSLRPRSQAILHVVLLSASCLVLPIIASPEWKPEGNEDPGLRIVLLLGATVGLPYLLLSTTGPLVQVWFARNLSRVPYRLFALSNLGSLIGLLAYPFAIEPWVSTRVQSFVWSASYVAFAILCAASAWMSRNANPVAGAYDDPDVKPNAGQDAHRGVGIPSLSNRLMWLVLSATGSMLLLAVSNHICQNIASIPFLWIVPLSLYLLTFVFVFDTNGWYVRRIFLVLAGAAVIAMGATLTSLDLKLVIPVHLAGLFVLCMVCHGELSLARPAPRYLTGYFLSISAGGVIGGLVIGFGAPHVLIGYFELGIVLVLVALLLILRTRTSMILAPAAFAAVAGFGIYYSHKQIAAYDDSMVASSRNFYGTLRVRDLGGTDEVRTLNHGAIRHGGQIRQPVEKRRLPTTYYGNDSGIGAAILALQARRPSVRVGVIGLGTGTIAAYGRPGDTFRFYDINTQVIGFAQRYFTFLGDSKSRVELALGDARLSLERESPQQFDILAIDAFSGDSVPAHLLTVEALDVYARHLKPNGVLMFHTTNRYLELAPVVRMVAESRGMAAALIEHEPTEAQEENELLSNSDWVIVTRDLAVMKLPEIAVRVKEIALPPRATLWTDDYNNLFHVLK
jgi:SAM-dependent methyltransferase